MRPGSAPGSEQGAPRDPQGAPKSADLVVRVRTLNVGGEVYLPPIPLRPWTFPNFWRKALTASVRAFVLFKPHCIDRAEVPHVGSCVSCPKFRFELIPRAVGLKAKIGLRRIVSCSVA